MTLDVSVGNVVEDFFLPTFNGRWSKTMSSYLFRAETLKRLSIMEVGVRDLGELFFNAWWGACSIYKTKN